MTLAPVMFETMYKGSWYTIEGAGGDLSDWEKGYQKMLDEQEIGTIRTFVSFSGKEMNEHYGLTRSNRYQDDLTFLAFPLDGLDVGKLAMFKIAMGDRWFDDIVDNNARREKGE